MLTCSAMAAAVFSLSPVSITSTAFDGGGAPRSAWRGSRSPLGRAGSGLKAPRGSTDATKKRSLRGSWYAGGRTRWLVTAIRGCGNPFGQVAEIMTEQVFSTGRPSASPSSPLDERRAPARRTVPALLDPAVRPRFPGSGRNDDHSLNEVAGSWVMSGRETEDRARDLQRALQWRKRRGDTVSCGFVTTGGLPAACHQCRAPWADGTPPRPRA